MTRRKKEPVKQVFVGLNAVGEMAVGSVETESTIRYLKKFECALVDGVTRLSWEAFDNPEEPRTIFQFILADRKKRIDGRIVMADRPPFAVVTIHGNRVVRLEFYEGHDALKLSYDLRSSELQGVKLPLYLEKDPQAYDPIEYLKSMGAIPPELEEIVSEILKEVHKDKGQEEGS